MHKVAFVVLSVFMTSLIFAQEYENKGEEFIEVSDPYSTVSGAYYGIAGALDILSYRYSIKKAPAGSTVQKNKSQKSTQPSISLLAGFGTPVYKTFYTGIEFEIFYRFKSGDNSKSNPIRKKAYSGFNMDVKFGQELPKYGALVYFTVGFSRVLGYVSFDEGKTISRYGTFHPACGFGAVKRLNDKWNAMIDFRYIIASKDDNKTYDTESGRYIYDAKPRKICVRLAITRQI